MRDGKEEIQPNFIVILQAIETSGCGRHSRVRGPYVVLVAFGQWTLVNMNADLSGAIECKLDCYSCMQNSSVAEVQFSPVLPPFFENREPNR